MRYHLLALACLAAASAQTAPAQQPAWSVERDSVLHALVAEALDRHPRLRQSAARLNAADRRVRPASALPDPTLQAAAMNLVLPGFATSRSDFTEWDLALAQEVPWPGTLGSRAGVARAGRDVSRADLAAMRRDVVASVATAYYRLRYVATALATIHRQRQLLEAAVQISLTRYSTGTAPQTDPLQARLARERLAAEEADLEGEYRAVRALVNALRDRPAADSIAAEPMDVGTIRAHLVPLPPAESLAGAAVASHPRIAARRAALSRSSVQIRLEQLGARPDLSLGVRYGYRGTVNGVALPDFFSAFVGIRLPIWASRKQHQLVAAARADSAGAAADVRDTELEIIRSVAETAARAEAGRRRLQLLEGGVLPAARATVESALRSYQVGRTEFLTLLAAEDALFRAELETAEVAAEHLTHLVMLALLTAPETQP